MFDYAKLRYEGEVVDFPDAKDAKIVFWKYSTGTCFAGVTQFKKEFFPHIFGTLPIGDINWQFLNRLKTEETLLFVNLEWWNSLTLSIKIAVIQHEKLHLDFAKIPFPPKQTKDQN